FVEANQLTYFADDAGAQGVYGASTAQGEAGAEELRDRTALAIGIAQVVIEEMEAEYEDEHQGGEQRERGGGAGIEQHGGEHAGGDEDQIGERIAGGNDLPHLAAVEAEEECHQRDVDDLEGDHHDE